MTQGPKPGLFQRNHRRIRCGLQDLDIFIDAGQGGGGGVDDGGVAFGVGEAFQEGFDLGQFNHGQVGATGFDQGGELAFDAGGDAAQQTCAAQGQNLEVHQHPQQVVWLPEALEDMLRLRRFLVDKNPAAARRVAQVLRHGTKILADYPEAGRPLNDGSHARDLFLPFGAGSYVLRPRQDGPKVVIVRVWHSKEKRGEAVV